MKKLIALVLVCTALLMLVSCKNAAIDPKYEDIIDRLEKGDYDGAIKEIEELKYAPETDEDKNAVETQMDINQMESLYSNIIYVLDNYDPLAWRTTAYQFYDPRVSDTVEFESKLGYINYLIESLEALGDYKDAKEYLGRIYKVEDKLLCKQITYTDAFGAEHTTNTFVYAYDSSERLAAASSSFGEFLHLTGNSYGRHTYEYDTDGVLKKITFKSGDTVSAYIEYKYEGSLLLSETFKTSDGDGTTVEYVYDNDGKVIEMKGFNCLIGWGDKADIKLEYDTDGKLLREYYETEDNFRYLVTYEYDSEGRLVYKERSTQNLTEYGADHHVGPADFTGWKYTYDSEGRIETETEIDLGHLDEDRNQVNYNGEIVEDPDLDFDRVTVYTYGTYYGVNEK